MYSAHALYQVMKVPLMYKRKAEQQCLSNRSEQKKAKHGSRSYRIKNLEIQ